MWQLGCLLRFTGNLGDCHDIELQHSGLTDLESPRRNSQIQLIRWFIFSILVHQPLKKNPREPPSWINWDYNTLHSFFSRHSRCVFGDFSPQHWLLVLRSHCLAMAEMSKIGEIELLKPLAVGTMAWGRTWLDEKLNRGGGELLILSVYRDIIYIYYRTCNDDRVSIFGNISDAIMTLFFNVQSWGNLSDETCAAIYKELTEADWSNGFFNHPTVSDNRLWADFWQVVDLDLLKHH